MYVIAVIGQSNEEQVFHGNLKLGNKELVFCSVEDAQIFIKDHLQFSNEEDEDFIIIKLDEKA